MGDPLRDRQSLKALADDRQVLEIAEEIGSFERLAESVERDFAIVDGASAPAGWRASPVHGRLQFAPAGAGEATATGQLEALVPAVCQRCLEPFVWPLTSTVAIRLVAGDGDGDGGSGGERDDGRETWELTGSTLRPIDMVDELLVMALPLSTRHQDKAGCESVDEHRADAETADAEMTRPFAHLKAQMDDAGRN